MSIPAENLSLIVHYALQGAADSNPNYSAALSLISGFSLASQNFRQIALREIFRTYHVTSDYHLQRLDHFPDMYKWIRVLHCPANLAIHVDEKGYARFAYLRCVHLTGSAFGLWEVLERLPLSVQEMTLPFDHANDHTRVLSTVSRFQNLISLRVTASRFEVPPATLDTSPDAPQHHVIYCQIAGRLLSPLTSLRYLQIDHYLTDSEVFDFHASQCPWSSASTAFCPTCWDRFGEQTVNAETMCTRILASGIRSLQAVAWQSWFTANAEGHSRVFIDWERGQNTGEEIRVWRERQAIEADWVNSIGLPNKHHRRSAQ